MVSFHPAIRSPEPARTTASAEIPPNLPMYSTCIFCNSALGANESVERFPVGRRVAFDGEKGRLWAVCGRCGRWNLSPLETRWEAIEECERLFRDTRTRVSTGNVGLARLAEGLDLVRVGRPLRPEFAAWRYGDQFGRRLLRTWLSVGSAGGWGLALGGLVLGLGGVAAAPVGAMVGVPLLAAAEAAKRFLPPAVSEVEEARAMRTLRDGQGAPILHDDHRLLDAKMHVGPTRDAAWAVRLTTGRMVVDPVYGSYTYADQREHLLTGAPALHAVPVLLARANGVGGTRAQVQDAVRRIEQAGAPERYFARAERDAREMGLGHRDIPSMPIPVRLAMEMAANEDGERRAMEGELAELERRWREAEEIARVADRLAVSPEVERRLGALRRG